MLRFLHLVVTSQHYTRECPTNRFSFYYVAIYLGFCLMSIFVNQVKVHPISEFFCFERKKKKTMPTIRL